MNVTIKDVAQKAGVSYSTVSKALNNSPLVKPETKKKIIKIAHELGYTPNFTAKNLVSKKSHIIGLVWPSIDRIALSTLVSKINEIIKTKGYSMILSVDSTINAIEMFQGFRVDGIILFDEGRNSHISKEMHSTIPILTYGVPDADSTFPYIDVNHREAIHQAVSYLASLGHTNISYIGEISKSDRRQTEKIRGYIEGMKQEGLEITEASLINTNGLTWYDGYLAAQSIHTTLPSPTAIISGSYDISVGLLRAVKEQKIAVPDSLSIISYDNIPQMQSLETKLSSTGVPLDHLAHEMVEYLINMIENPTSKFHVKKLKPVLEIRESCQSITARNSQVH